MVSNVDDFEADSIDVGEKLNIFLEKQKFLSITFIFWVVTRIYNFVGICVIEFQNRPSERILSNGENRPWRIIWYSYLRDMLMYYYNIIRRSFRPRGGNSFVSYTLLQQFSLLYFWWYSTFPCSFYEGGSIGPYVVELNTFFHKKTFLVPTNSIWVSYISFNVSQFSSTISQ